MLNAYKSIILVTQNSELKIALDAYNRFEYAGSSSLILAGDDVNITGKKYQVRSFQFYQKFFRTNRYKIAEEAYDLFYSLARRKINEELTLREFMLYKGVSLWDLSVQNVFSELLPILYDFNMLEVVLDFEKPSDVYVVTGASSLEKILGAVCVKKKIKFSCLREKNGRSLRPRAFFNNGISFLKEKKRFFVNLVYLFSNLMKSRKLNKEYKILFFAPIRRYLDSILPIMLKYDSKERLVINTFLSGASEKLKESGISYMDFHGYGVFGLFDRHALNLLKKIQGVMQGNSRFFKEAFYKEMPIGDFLAGIFVKLIYDVLPNNIRHVDIINKICLLYKPKVVVVAKHPLDIVLTAKSLSIPVVGVQSGFVDEFYYYGPIIADVVTVDGNYWKEYLLKRQKVDPDRICVAGPVKFDCLPDKESAIGIKEFCINTGRPKKIVVFATTARTVLPIGMLKYEKTKRTEKVCGAMSNIKDASLIIKLHPYENNMNFYRTIAKEQHLANFSIVKDIDMWQLLHACDLFITHLSTASYDAVLMDKNVISLCGASNFEAEDIWDFRRHNAAMILDNLEDLEKGIQKALFDPYTVTGLKKGREEYIRGHAHRLDGRASDRVKEAIARFL